MYRQLETDRLLIRPLMIDDDGFILELLNTKGWLEFIGDRKVKDIKTASDYIRKILENDKYFYHVYALKDTKLPVGIVTFLYRDNQKYPDIGFAMLPNFEKKGYALEAAKKYLEEIIKDRMTEKIIAITKPDNINSIRLLEKLGLLFEKTYFNNSEQLCLYSMTL